MPKTLRERIEEIIEIIREEGSIEPERLAFALGLSLGYVKYQLLKIATKANPCIKIEKDRVVWACSK